MEVGHEVWGRDGISSWYLTGATEFNCPVVHQVRHPLGTIASLLTIGAVSWDYMAKHMPLRTTDPLLLRAMQAWYHWNLLAQSKAVFRYRVEDVASVFHELCRIGSFSAVFRADYATPRTANSRPHVNLVWSDLENENEALAQRVKALAVDYGYVL